MSSITIILISTILGLTTKAPNYCDLTNWAAHPDKEDMADINASDEVNDMQAAAVADVFFVHPTTFVQRTKWNIWNAEIHDAVVNKRTDDLSIKNQASAFNGSARVYAPRYRQAHLKAFIRDNKRKQKNALDLAYEDVKQAFEYYLENWNNNRPIIIASHSQGTRHTERLIKDYFDGKALSDQLVAAYLVGGYVSKDAFDNISVCQDKSATGCFVAWRTYNEGFTPKKRDIISDEYAVVNPINWTTSQAATPEENQGVFVGLERLPFITGMIGARISKNQVIVDATAINKLAKEGNLHNYDYNLFYMNIRKNVADRVAAFTQP